MMRTAAACLLTVSLAVCGLPGVAAAKKKPQSSCQKLAKAYKDRASDRKLVLVVRGDDETGRISACVLPTGKVRTLASWDDGLGRDGANIVATAGTRVLVQDTHGDQYGGTSRALTRIDVRDGRRLSMSSYGCMLDYSWQTCPSGTNFGEVVMARSGAGAYEFSDFAAHTTTLRSFSAAGVFATLAAGAVDALRLEGTRIAWTQAGVQYTAALP